MTDHTAPTGWTVDTLRVHVAQRLDDLQLMLSERYERQTEAIATALQGTEKAVTRSEANAEKRFDALEGKLDAKLGNLEQQLHALGSRVDLIEGRSDGANDRSNTLRLNIGQIIALVAVLISIAAIAVGAIISG